MAIAVTAEDLRAHERGVRIGVATSVTSAEWEGARVWPLTDGRRPCLTDEQQVALCLFSAQGQ